MYISVDLEDYSQDTADTDSIFMIPDDYYNMYCEKWQQFDPEGTQYIRYDQLSDFLDALESPLQVPKPNKYKIITMDIPICRGGMIFGLDILDALTNVYFEIEANTEINYRPDVENYYPISSTLSRELYCIRVIRDAWRKYKLRKNNPHGTTGDENDGLCDSGDDPSARKAYENESIGRQTAVLVESDGFVTED